MTEIPAETLVTVFGGLTMFVGLVVLAMGPLRRVGLTVSTPLRPRRLRRFGRCRRWSA